MWTFWVWMCNDDANDAPTVQVLPALVNLVSLATQRRLQHIEDESRIQISGNALSNPILLSNPYLMH